MRYQIRPTPEDERGPMRGPFQIVDLDGVVVAEGHLVADYVGGTPESLIVCGVGFEGVHRAATS